MKATYHYADDLPLQDKILYVLHLIEAANTQDIVAQIAELDGLAAEEAVAVLHIDVEAQLQALEEAGRIERLPVHGRRFRVAGVEKS